MLQVQKFGPKAILTAYQGKGWSLSTIKTKSIYLWNSVPNSGLFIKILLQHINHCKCCQQSNEDCRRLFIALLCVLLALPHRIRNIS